MLSNPGSYKGALHRLRGLALEIIIRDNVSIEGGVEIALSKVVFGGGNKHIYFNCCRDYFVWGRGDKNYFDFKADYPKAKEGRRLCSLHKTDLIDSIKMEFNIDRLRGRMETFIEAIEARGYKRQTPIYFNWYGVEMSTASLKEWDAFYYNPTTDKYIALDFKTGEQGRATTAWRFNHPLSDKVEDYYIFNLTYNLITKISPF